MIKNIVFDLGGVVIGRDYKKYGSEIAEFSFLQGDRPFPSYWIKYDKGEADHSEVIASIVAENNISPQEAADKLEKLMLLFNEFHDTVELIEELYEMGYDIYILSNMPAEFINYVSRFPVFRFFKGMLISSAEKLAKPDPRFFRLLTERFGIEPCNTLFVDDKPSNTKAGAALGFHTHLFSPCRQSCDEIRELVNKI